MQADCASVPTPIPEQAPERDVGLEPLSQRAAGKQPRLELHQVGCIAIGILAAELIFIARVAAANRTGTTNEPVTAAPSRRVQNREDGVRQAAGRCAQERTQIRAAGIARALARY